jgi:hypothetical protein
MNISSFLLSSLQVGLVYSLFAILVERILVARGFVRGNIFGVIFATLTFVFMKQLIDYSVSVDIYGIAIIIISATGANRYDLIKTVQNGKWWWKRDSEE